jgi:hypothetical protein
MTQPESRLSRKIKDHLQAVWGFDCFVFKVWGSEHMMAGLPDLIGCVRGCFFALEVKLPANRSGVSPRQRLVMGMIARAGGITAVVCSPAEAVAIIRASLPEESGHADA